MGDGPNFTMRNRDASLARIGHDNTKVSEQVSKDLKSNKSLHKKTSNMLDGLQVKPDAPSVVVMTRGLRLEVCADRKHVKVDGQPKKMTDQQYRVVEFYVEKGLKDSTPFHYRSALEELKIPVGHWDEPEGEDVETEEEVIRSMTRAQSKEMIKVSKPLKLPTMSEIFRESNSNNGHDVYKKVFDDDGRGNFRIKPAFLEVLKD